MKITALILATLATVQACEKWSFKCANDLFLCGIEDSDYGTTYPKDGSVKGTVSQGDDFCSKMIGATGSANFAEEKCPNGNSISHYNNYCSGTKCELDFENKLSCSGGSAGGGGDPHFRTYDGTQYSFHGECDLVMAQSAEKDIDIHIRTKSMGSWSLISNAAVRIGSDIFEFDNTGSHFFNGRSVPLPVFMDVQNIVTKKVSTFENDEGEEVQRQLVEIDLGNKEKITMTLIKDMIYVRVKGYFKDVQGMLGSHNVAGLAGRTGNVVADANEMGDEWQVRDTEKKLFREVRFPQYPQTCVPPSTSRRLRTSATDQENAEKACSKVDDYSRHFCIEDVLLTGNAGVADGYLFGEAF